MLKLSHPADFFAEVKAEIAGEVKWFGGVEGHLLDKGEYHLDLQSDFECAELVVALCKVEGESGFSIEAGTEDGLRNAGVPAGTAEDVVEVVFFGVIAHNLGKAGVVVEHLHVVGNADA